MQFTKDPGVGRMIVGGFGLLGVRIHDHFLQCPVAKEIAWLGLRTAE